MKVVYSSKWLLLRAQICKVFHKPFLHNNSSRPKLCSNYCIKTEHSTSFTNPDRLQNQKEFDLNRSDFPIQVSLSAKQHETRGRVYSGNNPSVTTILDGTRPKNELFALLNWRRGLIKELGEGGYNDKVAKIKNRGTTFHQAVKQYLLTGSQPTLHESNLGHWESVQQVISNIDSVIALESAVIHPQLKYAGTLDGIISYQGKLCVIDWKTSKRKRTELKDCFSYPHQVVAYAGAVNYDQKYHPLQISHGLLVIVYQDGSPADTVWLPTDTCEFYWTEWLRRLEQYNQTTTSINTSCHINQGKRMRDLAQYVNGVPDGKLVLPQDSVHSMEYKENSGDVYNDIAEWSESIIDVFEMDPSICEFDENY